MRESKADPRPFVLRPVEYRKVWGWDILKAAIFNELLKVQGSHLHCSILELGAGAARLSGKPFFKIDSSKKNWTLVNRREPHIVASTVGSQLLSKDFKDCYRSNSIEIGLEASLVSGLLTQQVRQFLSPSSSDANSTYAKRYWSQLAAMERQMQERLNLLGTISESRTCCLTVLKRVDHWPPSLQCHKHHQTSRWTAKMTLRKYHLYD